VIQGFLGEPIMDSKTRSAGGVGTTGATGEISQKHWNTPLTEAASRNFDSYVLVGKKGDETILYGSSDYEGSTNLIDALDEVSPS
jgi:hypothetical protein